jgi:hypothetical protein
VAERLVDTDTAFYRISFLALKRLVDTHQAFYKMSFWQKGWWIPTKHFIECHCGIKKAGGYPPSFLKKLIFTSKRLVDTYQAFYTNLLWHKRGLWIPTKPFVEYLFWHNKGWCIPTKHFIECHCGRKAGGYPPSI